MSAIWNSCSKSDTTRRPRTTMRAFSLRMKSTRRPAERLHDDLRLVPEDRADHAEALLDREERRLVGVDEDRDEHAVEDVAAAADEVDVAVRHGVERARVDGGLLHGDGDCTSRDAAASPSRRAERTRRKSAAAGGRTHHHAPGRRFRASASARPHDASGGGAPSPRNDSAASVRTAAPSAYGRSASAGGSACGRTWTRTSRGRGRSGGAGGVHERRLRGSCAPRPGRCAPCPSSP